MNKNTLDMSKGPIYKNILVFALPIFISQVFQQLYNSVDSIIVGQFLGKQELAAVSSSGNILFLFNGFFIGTAMGAGVVISKYFGKKDYVNMRRAIHTDIAFGLVSSVFLTLFGIFFSPTLLRWMDTASDVIDSSITYFRYYFVGVTGVIMYNIFNGILNAVGNSKRPLYYLIFSSVLNILLDLLFIGVFKLGVGAASVATAISQITSAILCLLFLVKKGTIYQVSLKKVRFHKDMIGEIVKYGMPSGIQNSVISIANVIVQKNINAFGSDAMAGCGSYSKLEGFAFIPIMSFNMAITTFVGQNLGAKEYDRAKKGSRYGIITSIVLAEIVGLIMYLLPNQLLSIFTSEESVLSYGRLQIKTICLFYFLLALSHAIAAVCRGSGKAIVPMIVMLAIWCGLRITYISIITHFTDSIVYIFYAYPLTWAISTIIYLIYYYASDWIHGFEKKTEIDVVDDEVLDDENSSKQL